MDFLKSVIAFLSLAQILLLEACNRHGYGGYSYGAGTPGSYRFSGVDYSHLDGLDASRRPTLSEKIRGVVETHYASRYRHSGWTPSYSHGHSHGHHGHGGGGGGSSFSHQTSGPSDSDEGGHGHGHGHGHDNYRGNVGHISPSWSNNDDGSYDFAAHNSHPNSVSVKAEDSDKKALTDVISKARRNKIIVLKRPRGKLEKGEKKTASDSEEKPEIKATPTATQTPSDSQIVEIKPASETGLNKKEMTEAIEQYRISLIKKLLV